MTRRRRATKVDWCLAHESLRHQTFTEFCDHGYTLWYYGEAEERKSTCRFTEAFLEVPESMRIRRIIT